MDTGVIPSFWGVFLGVGFRFASVTLPRKSSIESGSNKSRTLASEGDDGEMLRRRWWREFSLRSCLFSTRGWRANRRFAWVKSSIIEGPEDNAAWASFAVALVMSSDSILEDGFGAYEKEKGSGRKCGDSKSWTKQNCILWEDGEKYQISGKKKTRKAPDGIVVRKWEES